MEFLSDSGVCVMSDEIWVRVMSYEYWVIKTESCLNQAGLKLFGGSEQMAVQAICVQVANWSFSKTFGYVLGDSPNLGGGYWNLPNIIIKCKSSNKNIRIKMTLEGDLKKVRNGN